MSALMFYLPWIGLHVKLDPNQISGLLLRSHKNISFFLFQNSLLFNHKDLSVSVHRAFRQIQCERIQIKANLKLLHVLNGREREKCRQSVWSGSDKLVRFWIDFLGHKDT